MSFSDISNTTTENWKTFCHVTQQIPLRLHLRAHTCFRLVVQPEWRIPGRENPDLHRLLVRGGHGEYVVRGKRIELKRGVLAFVGSGVYHSSSADPSDLPQIIPIRFGLYANNRPEQMLTRLPSLAFLVQNADMARYEPLFLRLADCMLHDDPFEKALVASLLHQILVELIHERESSFHDPRITRLREQMDTNPEERLSLQAMAKHARICPRHLRRLFIEETGMNPAQYRTRACIAKARQLLKETNLSVKEIAAELGYVDGFTFSRQFKQVAGLSPSSYRQQSASQW